MSAAAIDNSSSSNVICNAIGGAVVFGATAVIIGNPIGFIGGAIFGGCFAVSRLCSEAILNESAGKVGQFVKYILIPIAAAAALWQAAAYSGVAMSFKAALLLTFLPAVALGAVAIVALVGIFFAGR